MIRDFQGADYTKNIEISSFFDEIIVKMNIKKKAHIHETTVNTD